MIKRMFRHYDYTMIVAMSVLLIVGLLMIYSASYYAALRYEVPANYFFQRQLLSVAIGLVALLVTMMLPYKLYKILLKYVMIATIVLLSFVLLYGEVTNNAQSWINVFGLEFQPSEIAKITIIIYLSSVFSKKQRYISSFTRAIIPPLMFVCLIVLLVLLQPDLGTAVIILCLAGLITICSGTSWKNILFLMSLVGMAGLFSKFFLSAEQLSRFGAAYNPFKNPEAGYQVINSYVAIASGGIWGRGFGMSAQKMGYLPEAHTDFIMAIVAEELGFFGLLLIIGTLFYLVYRGLLLGIRMKDSFGSLLAIGISSLIGIQASVNLGVVTGLLPTTGIPFPFISYGGSSLLTVMLGMGILLNVSMFHNIRKAGD
ncbi:FtsW/RodA/SpoVE family cell cycle protein [Pseudalkalibacillus hwajinpoensis]|uniref:FtsW/RodA/SpoVE family cell cycle protein n=1 Tax=Guptibacillus hwajinpoensis TaxID=208199 RepID=UPI00325B17D3